MVRINYQFLQIVVLWANFWCTELMG